VSTSHICSTGIEVETPDGLFISRGMLLITTVYLPARAMLCNMKQFSGAHACSTCEDPGDNTLGKTPLHRVWPFTAACKIRTPESVVNAFRSATNTGKAVSTYLTNVAQLFFPARWNRACPIKSISASLLLYPMVLYLSHWPHGMQWLLAAIVAYC